MNNKCTIFILIISVSIADGSSNYKPTSDQLRCTTTSTSPVLPPKGAPFSFASRNPPSNPPQLHQAALFGLPYGSRIRIFGIWKFRTHDLEKKDS